METRIIYRDYEIHPVSMRLASGKYNTTVHMSTTQGRADTHTISTMEEKFATSASSSLKIGVG